MKALADAHSLFSLKEAAVLSRLSEDKLRREVERKVIEPRIVAAGSAHRLLFGESEILFFAMLNSLSGAIELTPLARAKAGRLVIGIARPKARTTARSDPDFRGAWAARLNREWSNSINAIVTVNWDALIEDLGPRIDLYRAGLKRIREDDEILGGEPVFHGTRLAVRHIGGMRAKGEPAALIVKDYPELTADDVEFALLYTEAHPVVGRPKSAAATA
jgi:uncharacterized protein (DUF433 family)